ncbi:MAG TPA: type II secretion system protein [Armatimonadota bacterium]|jgi:prepilin-type N-terminal cleavage/methylation domain-containing protein
MRRELGQGTESRGFTLVELLVVIAIIAVLAALLFPVFSAVRNRARITVCQSNMKQLSSAFELYLGSWDNCYPAPYTDSNSAEDHIQFNVPTWRARIHSFVRSAGVHQCPSNEYFDRLDSMQVLTLPSIAPYPAETGGPYSYAMNGEQFRADATNGEPTGPVVSEADISDPTHVILLAEAQTLAGQIETESVCRFTQSEVDDHMRWLQPPYASAVFTHSSSGQASWLFCDGSLRYLRIRDTLQPRSLWFDANLAGGDGRALQSLQHQADLVVSRLPSRWR